MANPTENSLERKRHLIPQQVEWQKEKAALQLTYPRICMAPDLLVILLESSPTCSIHDFSFFQLERNS